jgi:DNA-binding response OmpR family regulator
VTTSRRILAVDNDQAFLAQLNARLSPAGFDVRALKDPARVVPEASHLSPDLVLIDRVLPVLTGAEAIRSMRSFPTTQRIPVAFVVNGATENELLRSFQSGAVDVLRKPLSPAHVPRISTLIDDLKRHPIDPTRPTHLTAVDHLLAFYMRERRTGTLSVNAGTPFEGRARFTQGTLAEAEYGPLRGREALEEMIQIEDGQWRFSTPGSTGNILRALRPSGDANVDTDPDAPTPAPVDVLPTAPAKPEPYVPRILVVDDEPALRKLFASQLTQSGVKCDQAEDGERGYACAREQSYDLIVSDLHMPRLDGWGMLQRLKADARTRETPVVILSAHDDYRETLKVARAGATDYLAKTGRAEDVVSRVMAILSPRLEFLVVLDSGLAVGGIDLQRIGVQWLLRALARNRATGTLHIEDEWGEYHFALDKGEPVAAKAKVNRREVAGTAAVASLVVCRNGEGSFSPGPAPTGPRFGMDMGTLLTRTCEALNQLDAKVVESKLAQGARLQVEPTLYDLFRRVASNRQVNLAKVICEDQLPLAEAVKELGLPAQQVAQGVAELLHRGVVRFA